MPKEGLNELLEATLKLLPNASRDAMIRATIVVLDKKKELAVKAINKAVKLAIPAGGLGGTIHIDSLLVLKVQLGMLVKIPHVHGIEIEKNSLRPIIMTVSSTVATTIAGRMIFSKVLTFLPGVGPVAGRLVAGVISAGSAVAFTKTLGHAYVEFLHTICLKNNGNSPTIEGLMAANFLDFFRKHEEASQSSE